MREIKCNKVLLVELEMTDVSQAFAELKRGAEEILVEEELLEKL